MKRVKLKFTYEIVMLLDDSEYEETKKNMPIQEKERKKLRVCLMMKC